MIQKIGPREQQLRDMRAAAEKIRPAVKDIRETLPQTSSGKKPVKRKKEKRQ
jgi:hypothetical protein